MSVGKSRIKKYRSFLCLLCISCIAVVAPFLVFAATPGALEKNRKEKVEEVPLSCEVIGKSNLSPKPNQVSLEQDPLAPFKEAATQLYGFYRQYIVPSVKNKFNDNPYRFQPATVTEGSKLHAL